MEETKGMEADDGIDADILSTISVNGGCIEIVDMFSVSRKLHLYRWGKMPVCMAICLAMHIHLYRT